MHGDVEQGRGIDDSGDCGGLGIGVRGRKRVAGGRVLDPVHRSGEVCAEVGRVRLNLDTDKSSGRLALVADECGNSAGGEDRCQRDGTVGADDRQRSRGGRNEFTQRDQIALGGKALERAADYAGSGFTLCLACRQLLCACAALLRSTVSFALLGHEAKSTRCPAIASCARDGWWQPN